MKGLNIFIILSIIINFKYITGDECSDFKNYKKNYAKVLK